jgi:hypothetical protein
MRLAYTLPSTIDEVSYDWCLGKPAGCIRKQPPKEGSSGLGSVVYRCKVRGKCHIKSFRILETRDEEATRKAAMEYGIRWSDEHGCTKNRIRRLRDGDHRKDNIHNVPVTNNTLEVFINDEHTMLIDFEDLHHVQQHFVYENGHGYAVFTFKGTNEDRKQGKKAQKQVHRYLTGYDMVDHINRNRMDKRRANLRETTPKENANNRTCKNNDAGVYFLNRQRWIAIIQQDGRRYSKSYSVKKYGAEAYEMAVNKRKEFCESFGCLNSGARQ